MLCALHTICLLAVSPGQRLVEYDPLPRGRPLLGKSAGNICLLAEKEKEEGRTGFQ